MNNSSSNLVNYTPCPYDISAVFTSVLAVLSLAAIIGNILVMSAVYKTPNLRTSTNYYYVNMAVSDFLSSLTLWPLYLTDEIITQRGSLIQGFVATIGCKVGVFTRNVSHSVSILSLFLIAVDRFIATVHPLKVTLLTKNIRASLLLSTWIIAIGGSFITFLHSRVDKVEHETFCRLALATDKIIILYTFVIILLIALYSSTLILYLRITRVLQSRLQTKHRVQKLDEISARQNRAKHSRNVMKIFRSIVIAFFICWFFFCCYLILKIVFPQLFVSDKCKIILGFSYYVFPLLSTVVNPVILFSFSSTYRHALKEIFSHGKCKSCLGGVPVAALQTNERQQEPIIFETLELHGLDKKFRKSSS